MAHYLNIDICPPNYVPEMLVEIEHVDLYGFNGRDFAPEDTDKGKQAIVKVIELGSDHDRSLIKKDEDYVMLVCEVVGENRVLELMSHEVLIVSDPR